MGQKCGSPQKLFSWARLCVWWYEVAYSSREKRVIYSDTSFSHLVRHISTGVEVTPNVWVRGGTGIELSEVQRTPNPKNPPNHTFLKPVLVRRVVITLKIKCKVHISKENIMFGLQTWARGHQGGGLHPAGPPRNSPWPCMTPHATLTWPGMTPHIYVRSAHSTPGWHRCRTTMEGKVLHYLSKQPSRFWEPKPC